MDLSVTAAHLPVLLLHGGRDPVVRTKPLPRTKLPAKNSAARAGGEALAERRGAARRGSRQVPFEHGLSAYRTLGSLGLRATFRGFRGEPRAPACARRVCAQERGLCAPCMPRTPGRPAGSPLRLRPPPVC